jgi:hypothetical protein
LLDRFKPYAFHSPPLDLSIEAPAGSALARAMPHKHAKGSNLTERAIQWSKVEYSGAKWRTADLSWG